jgi:hypothetical protein
MSNGFSQNQLNDFHWPRRADEIKGALLGSSKFCLFGVFVLFVLPLICYRVFDMMVVPRNDPEEWVLTISGPLLKSETIWIQRYGQIVAWHP